MDGDVNDGYHLKQFRQAIKFQAILMQTRIHLQSKLILFISVFFFVFIAFEYCQRYRFLTNLKKGVRVEIKSIHKLHKRCI